MIKLNKDYSDYTDETDDAYPAGKAVDATTEESIDGTPYLKKWMNNIHGAFTALWVKAFGSVDGMSGTPDSVDHSDVLLAVEKLIERPLSLHSDTRGANAHGATSAATEGQIVTRDQAGRAKVVAPVEADDIARKEEVDTEATARASADSGLQNQITTETSTRASADDGLQNQINSEASTRATADGGLQNQINSEASTRANADSELSGRITAEATARAATDAALQNAINILVPAGMIIASPLENVSQYLPCHGGEVSRADFPKLNAAMAAIGYPYGVGNGHSTFHLPPFNTQGAFLRGRGGSNAGEIGREPQDDAIRNIIGSFHGRRIPPSYSGSGALYHYETYAEDSVVGTGRAFTNQIGFDASRSVGTNHVANENRPINHAIYWHIKY